MSKIFFSVSEFAAYNIIYDIKGHNNHFFLNYVYRTWNRFFTFGGQNVTQSSSIGQRMSQKSKRKLNEYILNIGK